MVQITSTETVYNFVYMYECTRFEFEKKRKHKTDKNIFLNRNIIIFSNVITFFTVMRSIMGLRTFYSPMLSIQFFEHKYDILLVTGTFCHEY